ncbi:MAG: NAD(P)/FAD-dependent oxidoreductase [Bacteroidota bacterium]
MSKVVVIGGGLGGLVASIILSRQGMSVQLFERKKYPFHRVCGEYISNEVRSFLETNNLFPEKVKPANITRFQLTSINGKSATLPLDLGGFGISRYILDEFLAEKAIESGVQVIHERVSNLSFENDKFKIKTSKNEYEADFIVGAFGKRSALDKKLNRAFIKKRSPYIGVKYHIKYEAHDLNTVALHNFKGGYCGINSVGEDTLNLCYLAERENLRQTGSIPKMEKNILMKNPFLNAIFNNAEFLFEKPEVINEISFDTKKPVESHVLMCGDAAGMITPLCGNGMAIAIHSGKMVAETVLKYGLQPNFNRETIEKEYTVRWSNMFRNRLRTGRRIQKMFGAPWLSNTAVAICNNVKPVANYLMSKTHGEVF